MENIDYQGRNFWPLKAKKHKLLLISQDIFNYSELCNTSLNVNNSILCDSEVVNNAILKPTNNNMEKASQEIEDAFKHLEKKEYEHPQKGRLSIWINRISPVEYIRRPTKNRINAKIYEFQSKENMDESIVANAFRTYKSNDLVDIASKVIILNNRYSAGLNDNLSEKENTAIDVLSMAEIIQKKFDIAEDPTNAIMSLSSEVKNTGKKDCYSFLSKYYYWSHYIYNSNQEIPIYDNYTRGMIYWLNKKYSYIEKFEASDIKKYDDFRSKYIDITREINNRLNTNYSTRDFDMYFWKAGKEYSMKIMNEAISI